MARLFGILATILTLAACSSGVSNTGAGAAGTNCTAGELNMVCTASLSVDPTTIDVCATDTDGDGEPDEQATTDTGTMTIRIRDPLGEFSNTFQGVTFETYDVSYDSGDGGAPNLGSRRFTQTLSIELTDSTGEGSVTLPLFDPTTKREFSQQASCSTFYPYVVTVRATGRDFATNSQVVAVARINVQLGDTTPPSDEEEEEEDG